jgi:uncharacterized membrane protein
MGACASAFWFTAFSLASAAAVRTLALVEVLFSYAVGRGVLRQKVAGHEVVGLVLVVAGVALLLLSA